MRYITLWRNIQHVTKHVKKPHTTRECHTPHKYFMPPRTSVQHPNNTNQPSTSHAYFEKPKKTPKSSKKTTEKKVVEKGDNTGSDQGSEESASGWLKRRSKNNLMERLISKSEQTINTEKVVSEYEPLKENPVDIGASEKVKYWLKTGHFDKAPSTPSTPGKLPVEMNSPVDSASLVPISQIYKNPACTRINVDNFSESKVTKNNESVLGVVVENGDIENQSSLFDIHIGPVSKTYKNKNQRNQDPSDLPFQKKVRNIKKKNIIAKKEKLKPDRLKQRGTDVKRKLSRIAKPRMLTKEEIEFDRILNQQLEEQIKRKSLKASATVTSSSSTREDWTRLAEFRKEVRPKTRKLKTLNVSIENKANAAKIPVNDVQQKNFETGEEEIIENVDSANEKSNSVRLFTDVKEDSKVTKKRNIRRFSISGADKDEYSRTQEDCDQHFDEDTNKELQLDTVKHRCALQNDENLKEFVKPAIASCVALKEGERIHVEKLNKRQVLEVQTSMGDNLKISPEKPVETVDRKNRDKEKRLSDESRNSYMSPPLLSPAAGRSKLSLKKESLDESRTSTDSPPKLSPKLSLTNDQVLSIQDQKEPKIPKDSPRKLSQESNKSRLSLRKKGAHLKFKDEDDNSSNGSDTLRKNNVSKNKNTALSASRRSSNSGDVVSFKKLGKIVQSKRKIKMLLLGPLAPKVKDLQAAGYVDSSPSLSLANVVKRKKNHRQEFPDSKLNPEDESESNFVQPQSNSHIDNTISPSASLEIPLAEPIKKFTNGVTNIRQTVRHEVSMLSPEKDSQLQHLSRISPSHNDRSPSSSKNSPTSSARKNFYDYRPMVVMTSPRFKARPSSSDMEYQKKVYNLANSLMRTDSDDTDGVTDRSVENGVEITLHEKKMPRASEKIRNDEVTAPSSLEPFDDVEVKSNNLKHVDLKDADELSDGTDELFPRSRREEESSDSSVIARNKVARKLDYSPDSQESKIRKDPNMNNDAFVIKNASDKTSSNVVIAERQLLAIDGLKSGTSRNSRRSSKRKRSESDIELDSEILESRSPSNVSPSKTTKINEKTSLGEFAKNQPVNTVKTDSKRTRRSCSSDRDELEIIIPSEKTQLTASQRKFYLSSEIPLSRSAMPSEDLSIAYTSSLRSQLPKRTRKGTNNSLDKNVELQTSDSSCCDEPNQSSVLPEKRSDTFSKKVFKEVKSLGEGIDSIWEEKISFKEKKIVSTNPEPYDFANASTIASSMEDDDFPALSKTAIYGTSKGIDAQEDADMVSKRRRLCVAGKYSDSQEAKDHVCDDILDAVKFIRNRSVNTNGANCRSSPNMFSSSTTTKSNSTRSKSDAKSVLSYLDGKILNESPSEMFSMSSRSDSTRSKAGMNTTTKANGADNLGQIMARLDHDVDFNGDIQQLEKSTLVQPAPINEPGKSTSKQSTQKDMDSTWRDKKSPVEVMFPADLDEDVESIGAENHTPKSSPRNTRLTSDSYMDIDIESRRLRTPVSTVLVDKNSIDIIEKSPSPVKRRESKFRKVPEKVPAMTIKSEADEFIRSAVPRKILQEIDIPSDDDWSQDKVESSHRNDESKLKKRLSQNVPISENIAPSPREKTAAEFKKDAEFFENYSEKDSLMDITQEQIRFKDVKEFLFSTKNDVGVQKKDGERELGKQLMAEDGARDPEAHESCNTSMPFENSREKTVVTGNLQRESHKSSNRHQANAGSGSDEDIVETTPEKNVLTKKDIHSSQMSNVSVYRSLTSTNITPIAKVGSNCCIATPVASTVTTIKLPSFEMKANLDIIRAKNTPTTNRKLSIMYESTPKSSLVNKNKSMFVKSHVERKSQLNLSSVSLNPHTSYKEPGALQGEGRMCFVCSGLEPVRIEQVKAFARMVNAEYTSMYKPEVTHVIVKTDEEKNAAGKTLKFLLGIAQRKWVVGFKWIDDSMNQKKVLKEENYEAVDNEFFERGPERSRLREVGIFEGFAFFCVEPISDVSIEQYKILLESTGAKVVRSWDALAAETDKLRVFTVQAEIHESNIIGWYQKTKAVPVLHDWIIDCITQYRQITLLPYLQELLPEDVLALGFPAHLVEDEDEDEDEDEEDEEDEDEDENDTHSDKS